MSRIIEEKTGGDSRRPRWGLGLQQLHLKYYMKRALKRLSNLKPSTAICNATAGVIVRRAFVSVFFVV